MKKLPGLMTRRNLDTFYTTYLVATIAGIALVIIPIGYQALKGN